MTEKEKKNLRECLESILTSVLIGGFYTAVGDKERALQHLENARKKMEEMKKLEV